MLLEEEEVVGELLPLLPVVLLLLLLPLPLVQGEVPLLLPLHQVPLQFQEPLLPRPEPQQPLLLLVEDFVYKDPPD